MKVITFGNEKITNWFKNEILKSYLTKEKYLIIDSMLHVK